MPKQIVREFGRLKSERMNIDVLYQDVTDNILPYGGDFTVQYAEGQARNRRSLYTSEGEHSARLSASYLMGMIANPASKWFSLGVSNYTPIPMSDEDTSRDIDDNREVTEWLEECEELLYDSFNENDNLFYSHIYTAMLQLLSYGTTAIQVLSGSTTMLSFNTINPKDIYFTVDANGFPYKIYITRKMTLEQLEERAAQSGWNIPSYIGNKPESTHDVVLCIRPFKGSLDRGYELMAILVEGEHLLKREEYSDNPIALARWSTIDGEKYGRSSGMVALPDIKSLNQLKKAELVATDKTLNPAIKAYKGGVYGKLNLSAGSVTMVDGNTGGFDVIDLNNNLNLALHTSEELKDNIRRAFYVDIFQTIAESNRTATEAIIKSDEQKAILAPNVIRITSELITPLVQGSFATLQQDGRLPEPPAIILNKSIKVKHNSPIIKAQKASKLNDLMGFTEKIGLIAANANPEVLKMVDWRNVLKEVHESSGVPISLLLSDEQYQGIKEAEQAQMEQQMELEQAGQGAAIMNQLTQAQNANQ